MSEWISVKTALPEKHQSVLAVDGDGNICQQEYYDNDFYDPYFGQTMTGGLGDVTHWQPLPPAPKEHI